MSVSRRHIKVLKVSGRRLCGEGGADGREGNELIEEIMLKKKEQGKFIYTPLAASPSSSSLVRKS